MYYTDKIVSLQNIFGTPDVELKDQGLRVGSRHYPIRNDVILLNAATNSPSTPFAEDIQYTFGAEWKAHGEMLPEHVKEFDQYFDLMDLHSLAGARVMDLGCGSGRWSFRMKDRCRELVLVDFSEAIFVARENLRDAPHALFFKGDLTQLPFAADCADFLFCLGVLHHLPIPCLDAVRSLKKYAPRILIFLYYALDNRPIYFRAILAGVSGVRLVLSHIRWPVFRTLFSLAGTLLIYLPLVALGHLLDLIGLGRYVPLYEFYRNKSLRRIQQDVYDRFFTRIEQRVSRAQILELKSDFSNVVISEDLPYWHFLLIR